MRLAPFVFVFVLFALACGSEDQRTDPVGAGGTGGGGGYAPVFAGLDAAAYDPLTSSARLSWLPATDAETPAEEIAYRISVWARNPESGGEVSTYDWPKGIESCMPDCRYSYTLSPQNVTWFAVEAVDGDGMSTGLEVVVPQIAADASATPVITSIVPATAYAAETEVVLVGENFFEERSSLDGLTLGGKAIEQGFVTGWESRRISFRVPVGFTSGTVGVKTLRGTATTELEVLD